MRGRLRTVATLGALAAMALLLSGCIKLTMDLQVNSNDTVSGTVQLGIQKELLELSGGSIEDILGSDAPFPSDAPGVTVEEFDDGEFAGQQFNFDSVPIAQFQDQGAEALSITRQGDTFVVSGVLDMSGGLSGATGLGATGQEFLDSAQIRITMTFPGDVQEASGTIDGNSVTWEPVFGERLEISATASAIDDGDAAGAPGGDDGSSILMYVLIGVGVLVVVAIVMFFVMRSRRSAPPAAGGDAGFGAPAPAPAAPMAPGTSETPPAPPAPPAPPPPPAE
ncbi:MAG TPA: hypothetical protein VFK59_00665 [Actinomycetota bacterium]|nr:hypothetical protein [Actinomycetota bacterium]